MSLGTLKSGFSALLAVEVNADAAATLRKNMGQVEVYCGDIRDKSFRKFRGAVDLVLGGPPCQPFSYAGAHKSYSDPRDMIPEFIRATSEVRPRAFMMENVPGLISRRHYEYFARVMKELSDLGYIVQAKIFGASDFGVPQNRKRLFIIGTAESGYEFPVRQYGPDTLQPFINSWEAIHDAPDDEPNNAIVTYAKKPVIRPSPYAGMLVNGGGRPINLNAPAPTIPASAGGNRTPIVDFDGVLLNYHDSLIHGGLIREGIVRGVRRLTVSESARLQTFPDEFDFVGASSSKFRQIGNAVPPMLAEVIGRSLARTLDR